ncbi:MAG: hypothetical protein ACI9C4_001870, partial [Paraglaciecola sp.]
KTAEDWQFDTPILYYGETDRVQLAEGVINANKTFAGERVFNRKIAVDTLTHASATGAVAQPDVQTFTRPSGNGQYNVNPGGTPLVDTFKDTQVQFSAQWTQPHGKTSVAALEYTCPKNMITYLWVSMVHWSEILTKKIPRPLLVYHTDTML